MEVKLIRKNNATKTYKPKQIGTSKRIALIDFFYNLVSLSFLFLNYFVLNPLSLSLSLSRDEWCHFFGV